MPDVIGALRSLLSRSGRRRRRKFREWIAQGRPLPPPSSVKHEIIRAYAKRFAPPTFVETGTYLGSTVAAVRDRFRRVYSIELDEALYARARQRFRHLRHVTILHGDSGEVLPGLLTRIDGACLFWLDAHFSGGSTAKGARETPIVQEIEAILAHPVKGHVILVDDGRGFGVCPDFPTLEELRRLVTARDPRLAFEVADDVIRIHPR